MSSGKEIPIYVNFFVFLKFIPNTALALLLIGAQSTKAGTVSKHTVKKKIGSIKYFLSVEIILKNFKVLTDSMTCSRSASHLRLQNGELVSISRQATLWFCSLGSFDRYDASGHILVYTFVIGSGT